MGLHIVIATDAWVPQVNGVVRTLSATVAQLTARGHKVEVIAPDRFMTMPLPGYAEIRLAMAPRFGLRRMLDASRPDIVHIATEGPIGWAARGWCKARAVPFTTAFHTRFPDYLAVRTGVSADMFWPVMRRFHAQSRAVMVATPSLEAELAQRGLPQTRRWARGIDRQLFRPDGALLAAMADLPRPILLNVGRVAAEKNLEAFCELEMPAGSAGSKVVVGDGPALEAMRARYPHVHFLGALAGEALARAYRAADCFVFPSRTDTYGLVVIEALACGLPVAAYQVAGPLDILGADGCGPNSCGAVGAGLEEKREAVAALDDDLGVAVARALQLDRQAAARFGASLSWERATDQFLAAIEGALASAPVAA